MNYGWIGKTIFKKSTPNQQTEKNSKKVKLPNANKNHKREKRIFVQTLFSHSTFKISENARRKTTRFFRSNSCFGVTKITTPI